MGRDRYCIQEAVIAFLAFGLALAFAASPRAALSAGFDTDFRTEPRWSNDRHHWEGVEIGPDCQIYPAPGIGADYTPGLDAWGRPIIPLESPRAYGGALPLGGEIDFHLRRMQIGEYEYEIGGYIPLEPGYRPLSPYGPPTRQDCHPDFLPDYK